MMVLGAMLVLYIFAATFTVMVIQENQIIRSERNKVKAFYLGEAAYNRGVLRFVRWPNKKNEQLNIEGTLGTGRYFVRFARVDSTTGKPNPSVNDTIDPVETVCDKANISDCFANNNSIKTDTRQITGVGVYKDTSSGATVEYKTAQSIYAENPFGLDLWTTGTATFKSTYSGFWGCATALFSDVEVHWNIFGDFYSCENKDTDSTCDTGSPEYEDPVSDIDCGCYPKTDWRNECCLTLPFFGCVWRRDMGAKYRVNTTGDCDAYGGTPGSLPVVPNTGGCSPSNVHSGTHSQVLQGQSWEAPDPHEVMWKIPDKPFPQFTPPPDPRIPGSSSAMTYMTGAQATAALQSSGFLNNAWVDGDVSIKAQDLIWDIDIGARNMGIYGVVYINGGFNFESDWLTKLKLWAIPSLRNYDDGALYGGACGSDASPPPEGVSPGVLIINKGDLSLFGLEIDLGRVNIVMLNGNLYVGARCGGRTHGIYYSAGAGVDPQTGLKEGGYIEVDFTNIGGFLEALENLVSACDDLLGGFLTLCSGKNALFAGGVITKDVNFKGAGKQNVITNDKNQSLEIPEGFYSSVKAYNYRLYQ